MAPSRRPREHAKDFDCAVRAPGRLAAGEGNIRAPAAQRRVVRLAPDVPSQQRLRATAAARPGRNDKNETQHRKSAPPAPRPGEGG